MHRADRVIILGKMRPMDGDFHFSFQRTTLSALDCVGRVRIRLVFCFFIDVLFGWREMIGSVVGQYGIKLRNSVGVSSLLKWGF